MSRHYDVVVIGSGPGGYKAAIACAHRGAKVALVERNLPGGNCLNQGCIPKKALVHLASLLEDVANLRGRGLSGALRGDFAAAVRHKDQVVAGIRDGFGHWLRRLGVQVLRAEARLRPGLRVALAPAAGCVDADLPREISAPRLIIAAGSVPRELDACPTDGVRVLNSSHVMRSLAQRPASVLFVGGGAVGVELAYMLHQFGSRVTIVERGERLLERSHLPERAGGLLERKFARLGVEVRHRTEPRACRAGRGSVTATLSDGSERRYGMVVVAVGRRPRSEGLDLAQAGVETDSEGYIRVSAYLETSVPGIYAVGDVKPGPMTANAALHDAKAAATNACGGNRLRPNYHTVPTVITSALEIAAVGFTEETAEAAGFEPETARAALGGSGKARAHHDYEGFVEVVHDAETGQLLGGCIVGPEAGEQIHMLEAACQSPRGLWLFKDMSYSHPSWCEELESAVDPCTAAFSRSGREIFRPGIFAAPG
ncbi:MAG: dihydrolipoyl dehydrogenase family protein [Pseudomonadota bacterium]